MKKIFIIAAVLGLIGTADGEPITNPSQLSPNQTIIDFEQLPAGYDLGQTVSNPLVVGDVTFSISGWLYIRQIGSTSGGEVSSKLLEPEPDNVPLSITFLHPVSEVLLGWWDPNFPGNYLRAYDRNDQLLEEVEITDLHPPGGLYGTWIGFKRTSADISKLEVVPPTIVPEGQPLDNYGIDNIHYLAPAPQIVSIDIKPDSINLEKKSLISVFILSTTDFDAVNQINPESLTFGRTGSEDSLNYCTSKPKDLNRDGLKDLLCYFYTAYTGFKCGGTIGILRGQTTDGVSIVGSDSVKIIQCR